MFNIESRTSLKALVAVGFGLSMLVISSTAFAASGGGGGGGGGGAGGGEGGAGEAAFNTIGPSNNMNTLPHITIPTFVEQPRLEPCRTMKKTDRCH